MRTVQAEIDRLRAEYMEMPGLRLTMEQVKRLCGVEHRICQLVLDALVDDGFLCRKANGTYARLTDGLISRPRAANPQPAAKRQAAARAPSTLRNAS
jgi:hypothetical protein